VRSMHTPTPYRPEQCYIQAKPLYSPNQACKGILEAMLSYQVMKSRGD